MAGLVDLQACVFDHAGVMVGTVRSAITTSPIRRSGARPPATPEKAIARQPNRIGQQGGHQCRIDLAHTGPGQDHPVPVEFADTELHTGQFIGSGGIMAACRWACSCGSAQISPMVIGVRTS